MVNEKMVYNFAVNSQGFEGSFFDFQNLSASEKAEYEVGAGSEKSEAWQTGYEAAKQGEKLSDNPYEKTLWTHDEWISGYKEFLLNNPVARKIEFFTHENGMAVWAGEGRVLQNNDIVDCALDFGTDDWEDIYEAISEEISEGETDGEFANKYEIKYTWEVK